MPRQKPVDKIEMLLRQQTEIAKKLKEAEAAAKVKKRDEEQRRERLAGRCALEQLEQNPDSKWSTAFIAMLDKAIKRSADRELFPALPVAISEKIAEAAEVSES